MAAVVIHDFSAVFAPDNWPSMSANRAIIRAMSTVTIFVKFIQSLIGNWIFWFGALLTAEQVIENLWPGYKRWLDKHEVIKVYRAKALRWGAAFLVFLACFQAYQEQYNEAQKAILERDKVLGERDEARPTLAGKMAPGHLNSEEHAKLLDALSATGGEQFHVTINSELGCGECEDYAIQLRKVAREAKWKVAGQPLMAVDPNKGGLRILVQNPTPKSANVFALALGKSNIGFEWGEFIPNSAAHIGVPFISWEDYAVLVARDRPYQEK
ncbi:MAG: hypothetical protein ACLPWS_21905 [Rhodomicrobium sp.]